MMKKIILGVAALSLVGASVMYMSSCAIKQGPLSPNTNQVSSTDSRSAAMPAVTNFTTGLLSLTGEIRVVFDKKMNPNTLTTGTVLIHYKHVAADNTTEAPYTAFSITYVDELKTLILRPTDVAGWRDNTRYRIQLMHGVASAAGVPLDGNNNNINDGNVLDDYHNQFYTSSAPMTETSYNLSNLTLLSVLVQADIGGVGNYNISKLTNHGNVPASYTYVTITASFQISGIPANLDPSASMALANVDAGGAAPTVISSTVVADQIILVVTLSPASRYELTMLGGLSGIRSSSATTEELNRGMYFARGGTSNSKAEANDKYEVYLSTSAADNTAITYPDINAQSYSGGSRWFRVRFTEEMDLTTLTNANIQLIGNYSGDVYNIVPKLIDIVTEVSTNDTVYVYLPDRFYPADYTQTPSVGVKILVRRYVKSAAGQYFDDNGDGVVLTDDDDHEYGYFTFSSGI